MEDLIRSILTAYGFTGEVVEQKDHLNDENGEGYIKHIFSITLTTGEHLVIKLVNEQNENERERIERQSAFSERLRARGIATPRRYLANGMYSLEVSYRNFPCFVTVEDWCGEELLTIDRDTARRVGALMARMHILSLEEGMEIGCGTLFSAAYWNDVDAFDSFCEICKNEALEQTTAEKIKALRAEKLARLRGVWQGLPKSAVQGDISINNLVNCGDGLIVFDYNNAGDEVLVSDLVLEGLLTAYEMDLPEGACEEYREELFPAFLEGYLSQRRLTRQESEAAWDIYTLYHALWFTRVIYNEASLEKLVERGDCDGANALLRRMLKDMTEPNDGRFLA